MIWTSPLTGLVRLSDKFTTGSSIMPQKRNPDAAELVRAKTGRIIGALNALLIVMKGLPLAYAKDMQEDKEGAMDALEALALSIAAMTGMVADLEPDVARMKKAAGEGYATATDLADWLVRTLKMPFRDAHHATGRIVAKAAEAGVALDRLPLAAMRAIEPRISEEVYSRAVGRAVGKKPHQLRRHRAAATCARRRRNGCASLKRRNPDFALIGGFAMFRTEGARFLSRYRDRPFVYLVLIGALGAASALAGCGRKGPLDPPPGASLPASRSRTCRN